VVTVNDYLARRDAEWMGRLYNFLGLSVGVVYAGLPDEVKRAAYQADITYGQNNEFGFDYLRDNMKFSAGEMFQRGHAFAIVDEVDSILIDEARTPLIISGPAEDPTDKYYFINKIIPHLKKGEDFEMDLKTKQPTLTEAGVAHAERLLGVENLYDPKNIETLHHVTQGLRAHTTMERDVDYVVKDGQVIIVDEFTGRLMPGRRWSNGLHQAVEAKEGLTIARENQTLASVTFQNYFRMYGKLAGMTGTADTEAVEFKQIYNLEVISVPTNMPMVRDDQSDKVYRTRKEKYQAVVDDITEITKTGQPILVGTISIEQSEGLARLLRERNIPHNVLNAKHHEREAEIVAQAGRFGGVTISTNMAGRGTDIVLGGNPEFLAQAAAGTKDRTAPELQAALEKFKAECSAEKEKVRAAGGLFIMGTERHESRRIDNQLRGRAGRQGDPGTSRFYVSLEDDLMKRFGGDRMQAWMSKLGWEEGMAIDGNLISRSIESAQKKVEAFHFDSRKHVTEYDDVMNKQRQVVYGLRNRVVSNENIADEIETLVDDLIEDAVVSTCDERIKPTEWNIPQLGERFTFLFAIPNPLPSDFELDHQKIFDHLRDRARAEYTLRKARANEALHEIDAIFKRQNPSFVVGDFSSHEQSTFLESIDHLWNMHLQEMDHLREGIHWRSMGQKNPLHEYQREAFMLFQEMMTTLREHVVRRLFYYRAPDPKELIAHLEAEQQRREEREKNMELIHAGTGEDAGTAAPASGSGEAPVNNGPTQLSGTPAAKSVEDERARLEAQRKARRQQSRR
jgi:preprotein translocase subunit SecA